MNQVQLIGVAASAMKVDEFPATEPGPDLASSSSARSPHAKPAASSRWFSADCSP